MSKKSLPVVKSPALRLFLISFLILYFELVAIRFLPSQMRYVGFFSNIILLASFVGIGIGTIFWKKIKIPFYFFPVILFFFEFLIRIFGYDLIVTSKEVVYFNTGFGAISSEPIFLLPFIFFLIVLVFSIPSRLLGELLGKLPPLTAYSLNIAGSIVGIVIFSLVSFLGGGPVIWFLTIFIIALLLVKPPSLKTWRLIYLLCLLMAISLELTADYWVDYQKIASELKIFWSPYYKISLYKIRPELSPKLGVYQLNVNNIGHQGLSDPQGGFYDYPYQLFPEKKFNRVLVIGAGAGNDVARALKEKAKRIIAVEIDPVIADLGKKYHPLGPYSSEKVEIVIDDGRSYLVQTEEKFDLIIFALTDSLTLTSSVANLRLESYLFTKEAFTEAQSHLAEGGLVVLYNYYRSQWLVDKLALLLKETFGRDPLVISHPTAMGPAAVLIGAEPNISLPSSSYRIEEPSLPIPTDDWPFLYLKKRNIPRFYWSYLGVILVILGLVFPILIKKARVKIDWGLFFLGAAFMLLETKNVVQFSLLFGSTWLTNAFVFTGLLGLVLLAIWAAKKFPHLPLIGLYLFLFGLIAITYFFPQKELLNLSYLPRLLSAVVINFSPVFVANLIFALLFKKTKMASVAYGANIFGSFVGGVLEYTSLIWGYQNLALLVALFYGLSLLFTFRSSKN